MFSEAKPVWFQGLEKEKNIHAGFCTVFPILGKERVVLNLAGSTIYRVFLNGEFIQHGPARGPHGFYRVDELDLSGRVRDGDNLLAIEVTGANCHSFLSQPTLFSSSRTGGRYNGGCRNWLDSSVCGAVVSGGCAEASRSGA